MIFGRIIEARDEAAVEDVPGEECSARIVVRWAMHELLGDAWLDGYWEGGWIFELLRFDLLEEETRGF